MRWLDVFHRVSNFSIFQKVRAIRHGIRKGVSDIFVDKTGGVLTRGAFVALLVRLKPIAQQEASATLFQKTVDRLRMYLRATAAL